MSSFLYMWFAQNQTLDTKKSLLLLLHHISKHLIFMCFTTAWTLCMAENSNQYGGGVSFSRKLNIFWQKFIVLNTAGE